MDNLSEKQYYSIHIRTQWIRPWAALTRPVPKRSQNVTAFRRKPYLHVNDVEVQTITLHGQEWSFS